MPSRIPDTEREAILADILETQKSRAQIGRDHAVSPQTVKNIADEHGIERPFSREQTKNATEAALADFRARRAVEASESLAIAAALRENILTAAHGRDAQGWATAYGIMADKHVMFDGHDSDSGVLGARSLLAGLGDALTLAASNLADEPDGSDTASLP